MWIEKNIMIINKCRGFHLITDEIEKKRILKDGISNIEKNFQSQIN